MVLQVAPDGTLFDAPLGSGTYATVLVPDPSGATDFLEAYVQTGGGSTINNAPAKIGLGLGVTTTAALAGVNVGLGLGVNAGLAQLAVQTMLGISITVPTSMTVKPAIGVGIGVTLTETLRTTIPTAVGFELDSMRYNLTRKVGASSSTSTGAQAWPNPANANGIHDGTSATATGNLTAAQTFQLTQSFPAASGKDLLTISACSMVVYWSVAIPNVGGVAVPGNTWRIRIQLAGTTIYDTGVASSSLNYLSSGSPAVDLYALGVTTWAKVNQVSMLFDFVTAAAGTTASMSVDASELSVTASLVDPL